MRNVLLIVAFIFTANAFANNNDAVIYNDRIIAEQNKIGLTLLTFSGNPNEFSLSSVTTQVDKSLDVLKGMKAFDGDKEFLISAKALFKFYKSISKNEYLKILQIIENKKRYTQEEVGIKIDLLTKSIAQKEDPLDAAFQSAQKKFANKYGFTLTKNNLSEKFTTSDEY